MIAILFGWYGFAIRIRRVGPWRWLLELRAGIAAVMIDTQCGRPREIHGKIRTLVG